MTKVPLLLLLPPQVMLPLLPAVHPRPSDLTLPRSKKKEDGFPTLSLLLYTEEIKICVVVVSGSPSGSRVVVRERCPDAVRGCAGVSGRERKK